MSMEPLYEDIDANDWNDPQAVTEYVEDIYKWLREKEVVYIAFLVYSSTPFLSLSLLPPSSLFLLLLFF